jgi:hypothetical protein
LEEKCAVGDEKYVMVSNEGWLTLTGEEVARSGFGG